MALRLNPYRPGSPVSFGMFAGRAEETQALDAIIHQCKLGNATHFLILGERGIGKSSLMFYLQCVAAGQIDSWNDARYRHLTVSIELEPHTDYLALIRKVGSELRRELSKIEKVRAGIKDAWKFLSRWEVMGVRYEQSAAANAPTEVLEELVEDVGQILTRLRGDIDGLVLLIDEADKPPPNAHLGEFCKIFAERLQRKGHENVCIGLAGLPATLVRLRQSHESSPRLFQIFNLEPLSMEERIDVVRRGLRVAKEKGGAEVTITPDAEALIATASEGYPHFIQQFAYSAFEADADGIIDDRDVIAGMFQENGAFQQLGYKYFSDQYFEKIASDDYRLVLREVAQRAPNYVTKADIRAATGLKESVLTNALTALKKRGIILSKAGVRAQYKLPTNSFAVWITAFTKLPGGGDLGATIPKLTQR